MLYFIDPLGEWCWIADDDALSRVLRNACFYGLLWASFAAASCAHFSVWRSLRRFVALGESNRASATAASDAEGGLGRGRQGLRDSAQPASAAPGLPPLDDHLVVVRRLMATLKHYPTIFLLAWVPASAFRLAQDLGLFVPSNHHGGFAFSLFVAW